MLSEVHKRLGKKIPIGQLFKYQTVRDLAGFIQGIKKETHIPMVKTGKKTITVHHRPSKGCTSCINWSRNRFRKIWLDKYRLSVIMMSRN
ncbi:acyl carrier protein [Paenibacillus larvae]|uniref:acyl carrier protein n=1 Tax=Paenibacillus larvae TaxID=1464 RepID=UPI00288FF8FA|nr:phosphopantetheine-binding protein [Paenibacillus larvae]MDT2194529.1 hypothetical protein [Paenibacillus larvae]MDT2293656.1 hypothetical protein [Paenibacillus larvae]MDT2305381.1 hypothetical protein [Paenibacillus larvae]